MARNSNVDAGKRIADIISSSDKKVLTYDEIRSLSGTKCISIGDVVHEVRRALADKYGLELKVDKGKRIYYIPSAVQEELSVVEDLTDIRVLVDNITIALNDLRVRIGLTEI